MEFLDMELARARQRLNRAELSLKRANEMLDEDRGVGINIALCSRIRAAQRRVVEARSRLTKIDPTGADGVRTGLNHPGRERLPIRRCPMLSRVAPPTVQQYVRAGLSFVTALRPALCERKVGERNERRVREFDR
ncbi:hypothetical protein [Mesorhizobium escarrei]|uniref:hypothetical protein n=1 Tax=Mesorhizobium escarrei TaxID=666018 RepID=UPI0020A7069D|nr:hypothetical protein [Mesorhizobium escarrei]